MKNKKTLKFLLLPVTLLLLILIIHNIELSNLYSTIVRANLGYLILAVALQASSILVRNLKWQIFVNGIKKSALLFPISHVTCWKLYGYRHTRTAGRRMSTKSLLPVEEDKGEQGYLSLYGFGGEFAKTFSKLSHDKKNRFIFYIFSLGFGYISLIYLNSKYGKY